MDVQPLKAFFFLFVSLYTKKCIHHSLDFNTGFLYQEELDNTITMEDQIYLLLEAKVQCEQNLTAQVQEERGEGILVI